MAVVKVSSGLVVAAFCLMQLAPAYAESPVEVVIAPDAEQVNRVQVPVVNMAQLDEEMFELGVYTGAMNVADFGSSAVYGARAMVHASSRLFFDLVYGRGQVSDETFYRLNLPLFGEQRNEPFSYYGLMLGVNLFPGEVYLSRHRGLASNAYVAFGLGGFQLLEDDYGSWILGMGLQTLLTDWLAFRMDARMYEYQSKIFGYRKTSHNFESTIGMQVFF